MILRFATAAVLLAGLAACNDYLDETRPAPDERQPAPSNPKPDQVPGDAVLPDDAIDEGGDMDLLRPGVPVTPVPHEPMPNDPPQLPAVPEPAPIEDDAGVFDREFIAKAAVAGRFEVESSQMAVERASDPATIEFALMMIDDHSKANDQLAQIARAKGIDVPEQLDGKHREMLNQLSAQESPEAFAQRYHDMQLSAHEEAIKLFEQAAADAMDSDIKKFASDTLPTLRKHLDHLHQHDPAPR